MVSTVSESGELEVEVTFRLIEEAKIMEGVFLLMKKHICPFVTQLEFWRTS